MKRYDTIIIGAGFAGAVIARELAEKGNEKVLILEKRHHIGGNAFDCYDTNDVLIHLYGPHIFHTMDSEVYTYLSQFTEWFTYSHQVVADIHGKHIPVPFNFNALEQVFGLEKGVYLSNLLCSKYKEQVSIRTLMDSSNPDVKQVADYVYNNIFLHYTMKQWGKIPDEIDPATTERVPIRLSSDNRYFTDTYQGIPKNGYSTLFEKMLDHENITIQLNADALTRIQLINAQLYVDGQLYEGKLIYTGSVDSLFQNKYGLLPYRTLDFHFETYKQEKYQDFGTVNYTVDMPYTRITEFKHLTGQLTEYTTIVKEYPRAFKDEVHQLPFYPINNEENEALYLQYVHEANKYPQLHLLGRLAEYRYYNMDAIIKKSLELSKSLLKDKKENRSI